MYTTAAQTHTGRKSSFLRDGRKKSERSAALQLESLAGFRFTHTNTAILYKRNETQNSRGEFTLLAAV